MQGCQMKEEKNWKGKRVKNRKERTISLFDMFFYFILYFQFQFARDGERGQRRKRKGYLKRY